MMIAPVLIKTKTIILLFPVCFSVCESQQILFYPLFGGILSTAINRSPAAQKNRCSLQTTPFLNILAQGFIWRFNSPKQFPHLCPLIPTSRLLRQNCTFSLHVIVPYPSPVVALILGCTTDKKIGVVYKLHLLFITEISAIFRRYILNKYSLFVF